MSGARALVGDSRTSLDRAGGALRDTPRKAKGLLRAPA